MKRTTLAAILAGALGMSAPVLAQPGTGGTITDGDVVFVQGDSPTSSASAGPLGEMRTLGAAGPDHLFQNWWWYRVEGVDTREQALAGATSGAWSGNTGTVNFAFAPFSAVLTYVVTDRGVNDGLVVTSLRVTNTSAAPITIDLFNYHDFDVQPNLGDDRAVLLAPGNIEITDAANVVRGRYDAVNAGAFQVGAFQVLRTVLTNAVIDDLNNMGLPFGPGDFTGAYQWTVTLTPNESRTFSASFGIAPPAPLGRCCTGDACSIRTEADCRAAGGVYAGDGTACPVATYTSSACDSNFEDISSFGTAGPACDDCGEAVDIGFPFNFFGNTFTAIGIASNGYLSFGSVLNVFSNAPIPSTGTPNDLIAGFWDDLNTGAAPVQYATLGDAGARRFIAQWTNVPHFNAPTLLHTFQIVLFEGTNDIEYRYTLLPALGGVVSPSVGLEDSSGASGISIPPASIAPPACVAFAFDAPKNPCAAACPCNWNGDASLNSQDFFDFLVDFFDGDADYNDDGQTNSQDFFDFLTCFFAPPAGCK